MKSIVYIIIAISFSVSGTYCQAQINDIFNCQPGDALDYLIELNQSVTNNQQSAFTNQIGNSNSVEIYSSQQLSSDANLIISGQTGHNNQSVVTQNGDNQLIGIMQYGNGNTAQTTVIGNNIFNAIIQNGNNNFVKNDIENSPDIDYKIVKSVQVGDQNSITLQTAMDFSTITVKQFGSNNTADLNLTGAGLQTESYSVEQNGNGSEVSVTQSDFYMPMQ